MGRPAELEPGATAQVYGPAGTAASDSMLVLASADLEVLPDDDQTEVHGLVIPMESDQVIASYTDPENDILAGVRLDNAPTPADGDTTTLRYDPDAGRTDLHSARTELLDGSVDLHSAHTELLDSSVDLDSDKTALVQDKTHAARKAPRRPGGGWRRLHLGASTWILLGIMVVGVIVLGILGGYLAAGMQNRTTPGAALPRVEPRSPSRRQPTDPQAPEPDRRGARPR